jgi:predicted metallo-beta-lactamase superfamily hydrolase
MKVVPLAAESLGVRSMATYVEAGQTGILIDPGATLSPSRFNLPPSEAEWEALRRANDRISAYAARASLVFVSHYHEDHFRSDPATYVGRTVLVKDPRRMVAGLQAKRGAELWTALEPVARVVSADGSRRRTRELELRVSPPLPHGVDGSPLGTIVALTVADLGENERFVFASDVQGPLSPVAAAYLIQERPTLLYLSGPPSYIEKDVGVSVIERGIDNLLRIASTTGARVIMDHHALRDTRFAERFRRAWDTGTVVTAAGYLGLPEAPLESRRPRAWAEARKAPARAGEGRAIMTPATRRIAKGGHQA